MRYFSFVEVVELAEQYEPEAAQRIKDLAEVLCSQAMDIVSKHLPKLEVVEVEFQHSAFAGLCCGVRLPKGCRIPRAIAHLDTGGDIYD